MKLARASVLVVAVAALAGSSGCGGEVTQQASASGSGSGSGGGDGGGGGSGGVGGGVGGGGGMGGAGGETPVYAPCEGKTCGAPCWCEKCEGPPTGTCDAAGVCVMGAPGPGICSPACSGPICEVLDDGPWLIGWAGGLDHYSWFRFTPTGASGGKLNLLESECVSCTGLYLCEGEGTYLIGPADNPNDPASSTILLELPASCMMAPPSPVKMLITKIGPAGPFPGASAELQGSVFIEGSQQWLEGFLYPPSHCDAAFTMCASPFD